MLGGRGSWRGRRGEGGRLWWGASSAREAALQHCACGAASGTVQCCYGRRPEPCKTSNNVRSRRGMSWRLLLGLGVTFSLLLALFLVLVCAAPSCTRPKVQTTPLEYPDFWPAELRVIPEDAAVLPGPPSTWATTYDFVETTLNNGQRPPPSGQKVLVLKCQESFASLVQKVTGSLTGQDVIHYKALDERLPITVVPRELSYVVYLFLTSNGRYLMTVEHDVLRTTRVTLNPSSLRAIRRIPDFDEIVVGLFDFGSESKDRVKKCREFYGGEYDDESH